MKFPSLLTPILLLTSAVHGLAASSDSDTALEARNYGDKTGVQVYRSPNGNMFTKVRILGGLRVVPALADAFTSTGTGPSMAKAFYTHFTSSLKAALDHDNQFVDLWDIKGLFKPFNSDQNRGAIGIQFQFSVNGITADEVTNWVYEYFRDNAGLVSIQNVADAWVAGGGAVTTTKKRDAGGLSFLKKRGNSCLGADLTSEFTKLVTWSEIEAPQAVTC